MLEAEMWRTNKEMALEGRGGLLGYNGSVRGHQHIN